MKHDNIAGSLYGLAIGDALGRPTEFIGMAEIYKKFGRTGVIPLPSDARVTDDTHMMLHYGRAAVRGMQARTQSATVFAREFRRATVAWYYDPEQKPFRAPGNSCMTAARALANPKNRHWNRVTTVSRGCGSNMRVAPIAFLPTNLLPNVAQLSAAMTHGHPLSLAATELTAWVIRWAAEGVNPLDLVDMALGRIKAVLDKDAAYNGEWLTELHRRWSGSPEINMQIGWFDMRRMMIKVKKQLDTSDTGDNACLNIGEGWEADAAIGVALYCAARHHDRPLDAVSRGARTSGDSDSIACLTGAIMGAHYGLGAWPRRWINQIEFSRQIGKLSDDLWSARR